MKKIFLFVLVFLISIMLISCKTSLPVFEPPTDSEKKIIDDWISEEPIIENNKGKKYIVWLVEWNIDSKKLDVWGKKGEHAGQINKDTLLNAINTRLIPVAVVVPVPIPAPIPVPVPVPTPAPVLPILPPTPIPSPTPIPTPTLIPIPTPSPTPTPPMYPNHCSDGQWNGDESDLDCGGSCQTCPPPGHLDYLSCWDNNDCSTGNCDMSAVQPMPAIDPITQIPYTTYSQLRSLAGQTWIIPWQGRCV